MELVHLSKETIPRKETSEVDEKLHPVNWYRPACRNRLPFRCRSQFETLLRLAEQGIPVTDTQVRSALASGKLPRPPMDGSLRYVFGDEHVEIAPNLQQAVRRGLSRKRPNQQKVRE